MNSARKSVYTTTGFGWYVSLFKTIILTMTCLKFKIYNYYTQKVVDILKQEIYSLDSLTHVQVCHHCSHVSTGHPLSPQEQ